MPPVIAKYQSIVAPLDAVAESIAVFPLHIVALLSEVIEGNGLTETITALLDELKHPVVKFLAST